jgi:TRIAD3 protein (E3 ubiquitin-protein ligase RNF216)
MNIIDIPSSPSQSPKPRSKPLASRGKPKLDNDTIILIDSDDEERVQRPHVRDRGVNQGAAGPSRRKQPAPLHQHNKDASSGSLENIPARRRPKSKSVPLFLPSDEENEPPALDDPALEHPEEPIVVDNFPSPPPDPIPGYVAQVLEIIPDVDPEYALSLIRQHYPESRDQVVEPVLHALFEDPAYPKLDKKGKRKRVEGDIPGDARDTPKKAKFV